MSTRREQRLKEQIVEDASKGKLDCCTIVSTYRTVTCDGCRERLSVRYIDYLKKGLFKFEGTQTIEAENPMGAALAVEEENATAIVVELKCEHCGRTVEVRPLTVEYLQSVACMPKPSGTMYT